jgi:hypothetical protein
MKTADSLPTPLDDRPVTHLTELRRRSAGEGYETITYRGDDRHVYEASVKDNIIAVKWRRLPEEQEQQHDQQ